MISGTISLGLGVSGIFLPGLPTTPFLLLTAGLYVRSSDKLYNYIIKNRIIGSYIRDFQSERGMKVKLKVSSISLMWIMIFVSSFFFIHAVALKLVLIGAGITGTIVMGFIVPTIKK